MGYFSWKTADTQKSISNRNSVRGAFPVYLLQPHHLPAIKETSYVGYGVFGGRDVYQLLAEWNAPELCNGEVEHDRSIGIDIQFGKSPVLYPIKFVENPNNAYEDVDASESCDDQGYFYDDEDNSKTY